MACDIDLRVPVESHYRFASSETGLKLSTRYISPTYYDQNLINPAVEFPGVGRNAN